jgi:glycosyltransferase involved in cell wall biosynthesis
MLKQSRQRHAAIASLHFAPAFAYHMLAYAKLLKTFGYEITFILHEKYRGFSHFTSVGTVIERSELPRWIRTGAPEFVIFSNAAVCNFYWAAAMRRRGAKVWYVFHEPDPVRNRIGEELKELAKLVVASATSIMTLCVSSEILVPSAYALSLYQAHFSRYNKRVHVLNLLFDDETPGTDGDAIERKHFSYIGNATAAHDFTLFLEYARYAVRRGIDIPISIATRTDLTRLLSSDLEVGRYVAEGRIEIRHGCVFPPKKIDAFFRSSFCIWNLYRFCTQSGVLPRAFMAGTPVVASHIASFREFVRPGYNGEFVYNRNDFQEITSALDQIRAGLPSYVRNCRDSFLNSFHYSSAIDAVRGILGQDTATEKPPVPVGLTAGRLQQ